MTTLLELERALGGKIRVEDGQVWLDTTIGDLRVAVIHHERPLTTVLDLAVFTPDSRELTPFPTYGNSILLEGKLAQPRLGHGFLFAGCRSGVLFATSTEPPTLEQIVGVLWELAMLARKPWAPSQAPKHRRPTVWQRRWRRFRDGHPKIVLVLVALWIILSALRTRYIRIRC